jgi:hypothetical protein
MESMRTTSFGPGGLWSPAAAADAQKQQVAEEELVQLKYADS